MPDEQQQLTPEPAPVTTATPWSWLGEAVTVMLKEMESEVRRTTRPRECGLDYIAMNGVPMRRVLGCPFHCPGTGQHGEGR